MIKLQITKHNGEVVTEEVKNYDPVTLNEKINNNEILTVVVGKRILSRIQIAEISEMEE